MILYFILFFLILSLCFNYCINCQPQIDKTIVNVENKKDIGLSKTVQINERKVYYSKDSDEDFYFSNTFLALNSVFIAK